MILSAQFFVNHIELATAKTVKARKALLIPIRFQFHFASVASSGANVTFTVQELGIRRIRKPVQDDNCETSCRIGS